MELNNSSSWALEVEIKTQESHLPLTPTLLATAAAMESPNFSVDKLAKCGIARLSPLLWKISGLGRFFNEALRTSTTRPYRYAFGYWNLNMAYRTDTVAPVSEQAFW
ncbi:hypothetical protein GQ457_02G042150 [Hibiscus cannabinus]